MTERYVPVSKLEAWLSEWGNTLFSGPRADLRRIIEHNALTPEAMTHEQMLATLKRCLESAESEHAGEKSYRDYERDQREEH